MNLCFSNQQPPTQLTKSLFLEGPSPRDPNTPDWRTDAIKILQELNYDGTVFLPCHSQRFYKESEDASLFDYDTQIEWETKTRNQADVIFCWLDRDIQGNMPGFTTNFELGEDISSGRLIYARPDSADKIKYIDTRMKDKQIPIYTSLKEGLQAAINTLGEGAYRENVETKIPLNVWKSPTFQEWYNNLKLAGHALLDVTIQFNLKNFYHIINPTIKVANENRTTNIESVLIRPHISTVIPYFLKDDTCYFIMIKEFRANASNMLGYTYEFPSGSSNEPNPLLTAQLELKEETSLDIPLSRIGFIDYRQLSPQQPCGSYIYTTQLTQEEFDNLPQFAGNNQEGEFTEILKIPLDKLNNFPLDASTLGILLLFLSKN